MCPCTGVSGVQSSAPFVGLSSNHTVELCTSFIELIGTREDRPVFLSGSIVLAGGSLEDGYISCLRQISAGDDIEKIID
jgi:hypothetical protein